jgi:aspartyl-tRNA(Asn)/glutamyl-tRNA(Gln) amidotransferase subunit A
MAKTVEGCAQAWQVMAGLSDAEMNPSDAEPLSLHISRNFGFDDLDPTIAEGFEALIADLQKSGMTIIDDPLPFLDNYSEIAPWHLTSVECRAHFENAFQSEAELFDPRVHSRMGRADELSAVAYRQTLNKRTRFVEAISEQLKGRVLLMPTVAILPPTFESLQDDEVFTQQNLMALRNTTLANIGDGCSLALPFEYKGVVLSLMLVGAKGADLELLALGRLLQGYL